jgi:hypothetical protein
LLDVPKEEREGWVKNLLMEGDGLLEEGGVDAVYTEASCFGRGGMGRASLLLLEAKVGDVSARTSSGIFKRGTRQGKLTYRFPQAGYCLSVSGSRLQNLGYRS